MASVSIEEYWIKARCQAFKCASRSTTSFTYSSTETLLSLYFTHPHLSIVPECVLQANNKLHSAEGKAHSDKHVEHFSYNYLKNKKPIPFENRLGFLREVILIRAYISISTSATIVLRIDRWHKWLIRVHDFSQEAENDLSQIPKILFELGFVFKKRNFNVGVNPCPSEE
jgi:hypothetical protein